MIAVQYRRSVPRYLVLKALGRRFRSVYTSALSPVVLCDVARQPLPTAEWVRLKPLLAGICGSDLATVCAKGSAYFSPLISTPFVLGHEVVASVSEVGSRAGGVQVGDRVVLQPALGCRVRGIAPPCSACADGRLALCTNVTRGDISAGIQTGYCRDTGGAWSESFVAHHSQVYKVPAGLEDELAVLTEPFACAVHAALRRLPADGETALVMGCGSMGLLTIAAMRALGSRARIVAIDKCAHKCELAATLGADHTMGYDSDVGRRYALLADVLGGEIHRPEIGKPTVVGGADVVFDCVASSESIDDCCRFTCSGGTMVLVGMPSIPSGIDWTSIWFKELSLKATYAYGEEHFEGRKISTFDLALQLLGCSGENLRQLVGQPFALRDYQSALRAALNTGASKAVKTVFRINDGHSG